jgi:SET domain-containing protein
MHKKYKKRISNKIDTEHSYYNNSQYKLKIDISTIKNAGNGVFALEPIAKNKFIGYYEGDVIFHIHCGSYYISINDDCGINAICFPRCYMAMINDTYRTDYKYNCEFVINENNSDYNKKVEIWSISDININDELFIDYGNNYWI